MAEQALDRLLAGHVDPGRLSPEVGVGRDGLALGRHGEGQVQVEIGNQDARGAFLGE